jgi:hypothetical protein
MFDAYKNSKIRASLERFFKSSPYYLFTVSLTIVAIIFAYFVRYNDAKSIALENCYNQTQIVSNCYDEPQCYNQKSLATCFAGAGYKPETAHDIRQMYSLKNSMNICYLVFVAWIIVEILLRFVSSPQWDCIYDAGIITLDMVCTLRAITGVDSFICKLHNYNA